MDSFWLRQALDQALRRLPDLARGRPAMDNFSPLRALRAAQSGLVTLPPPLPPIASRTSRLQKATSSLIEHSRRHNLQPGLAGPDLCGELAHQGFGNDSQDCQLPTHVAHEHDGLKVFQRVGSG